ncbi:hypothetical protein H5154_00765 [Pseudoalteromonas sp. SR44-5]|uniref:DUF4189 domain-containing protein n=1 Tax=Pseudoalteromonas rhizosphaerae TaxID=2518973 RepID=A0ABW8KR89_9GAMM|nr:MULTISPECIES: hypothetical protein [Pseudoalteromonas]MBB1364931.1 hypothetical protein [Pseudoalteromonas sp. SR44-5]MBB1421693.1 hypothetical protein [Pseudoalteromonas sp. SG43-7]MBB1433697.1 hypothetical protein [Pseudoalteromonas sp. SG43-6]MBB1467174.1 hypothetical protein [Pseudoalteromonas sp. SG41-5]
MSNNIKKQSLLGKTPQRKKPTAPTNKRKAPAQANVTQAQTQTASSELAETKKSRTGIIVAGVIVFAILVIPKPQLLTYEKLGLVTQSVYWPGLFGYGAMLFDSNLQPNADLARNSLYLCQNNKQPDTCQKYRVTEQAGFFSALQKLILD